MHVLEQDIRDQYLKFHIIVLISLT